MCESVRDVKLTAGYFCSTKDAKEKGAFRGYKVTNMASHAASLVYTLNALSSRFPSRASIKRYVESEKAIKLFNLWPAYGHTEITIRRVLGL